MNLTDIMLSGKELITKDYILRDSNDVKFKNR